MKNLAERPQPEQAPIPSWVPARKPREPRPAGERRFEIRDRSGTLVAIHRRRDDGQGKRFWWSRPDGSSGLDRPVTELPLYGSEQLRDLPAGEQVVLVEGEAAADALRQHGIPAVGTVTGAGAIPSDESLAVLEPFDIVGWPDGDRPGREHMHRLAARLHALGMRPRIYDPWPDCEDGSDAADCDLPRDGHSTALLERALSFAPPWEPELEVAPQVNGHAPRLNGAAAPPRPAVTSHDEQPEVIILRWLRECPALADVYRQAWLRLSKDEQRIVLDLAREGDQLCMAVALSRMVPGPPP